MRVSFHLVYRCIFYLLSTRSMRIIMLVLDIFYSFVSFGAGPTRTLCSYVSCSAFSWSSFTRQHVPDFSFSLVCILQVSFSSIGMLHTRSCHQELNLPVLYNHMKNNYSLHGLPLCSDISVHIFYKFYFPFFVSSIS